MLENKNIKEVILVRYHDRAGENTRLPDSLNKVQGVLPPLGLAMLAASFEKANIPVKIIDCPGLNVDKTEFEKIINELKPDIVGIGPMMTPALEGVFEAAEICKKAGAIVVVGGPHLSIYPQETKANKNIDFAIIGEGDFSFIRLVKALRNKEDVSYIPGLVWIKNSEILENPAAIVENLDELPIPAYHLLPMQNYNSIIGLHPVSTMMIGRGCPYRCGFCYKGPSDRVIRHKSIKNVIEEMKYLIERHKVKEIMFYDDTLTLKRDYVLNLCREIKKQKIGIRWEAPTRVNHIDEELIKELAEAGCVRLRMGVESGNEKIREIMNKRISTEQIVNAFKLCKKYSIETFAYFIIGYISETKETINDTINFAIKLDPDFAMFTTATPLPNTDLFEKAVQAKLIDPDYWKNYTLGKSRKRINFLVEDADKWTKKAYLRFYFRPKFIIKKLLKMRDLDTIKKYIRAFKGLTNL